MASRCADDPVSGRDSGPARAAPLRIMGVINVTPDSFSDGGLFLAPDRAIDHGLRLVAEGADILDVGGESTRPGAEPVSVEEELRRVLPVIEALRRRSGLQLSIDTTRSAVAAAALDAGASIVNDVSAGRLDPEMLPLLAGRACGCVLMHMQGTPRDMQANPTYGDVVAEVIGFLHERVGAALKSGVACERIWIDPGIGFGKTLRHNLELLARLSELRSLGFPICLGVSRKSFIAGVEAEVGGAGSAPASRVGGTAAALAIGVLGGASILRVHDVAVMRQAAEVARAIASRMNRPARGDGSTGSS